MNICVLSTDERSINTISKVVSDYSLRKLFDVNLKIFKSLNNFLNSPTIFDILFVDDCSQRFTSFLLAKQIRAIKPRLPIVILSSNFNDVSEAFKIRAYRFLIKPFSEDKIIEALNSCRRDMLSSNHLIIKIDSKFCSFALDEIYYIRTEQKVSTVSTLNGMVKTFTSFPKIYEQIPSEFFFVCHRCIAVNMRFIREFTATEIILMNGEKLPLSKRRKMDFYMAYNDFIKSHTFN